MVRNASVIRLVLVLATLMSGAVAHGDVSHARHRMAVLSRQHVLDAVTDSVRPTTAVQKYGGDFGRFWAAESASRTGKFAEAQVALGFNRHHRLLGQGWIAEPTALRNSKHPFDLKLTHTNGRTIRYQMKLGHQAARNAVMDPRYSGGRILTPPDELAKIKADLARKVGHAKRRGVPLPDYWQRVQRAIRQGRLTDALIDGRQIATRRELLRIAERYHRRVFGKVVSGHLAAAAARATVIVGASRLAPILTRAGKALGPLAVGVATAVDLRRVQEGKLSESEFAARIGMRVVLEGAAAYTVLAGAGPAGWVVLGVTLVAEAAIAHRNAQQDALFQRVMSSMEVNDRYSEVRAALLRDMPLKSSDPSPAPR